MAWCTGVWEKRDQKICQNANSKPLFFIMIFWGLFVFVFALKALAQTHEFVFNASLIKAAPDGTERNVIGINGEWPLPIIRVAKNDRVIIHLTNEMTDRNVSLHFHGLFMKNSNSMDGPEHITQCPIPPGHTFVYDFVVDDQVGTYWYHSHSGSQYGDGLRGMFIVEENKHSDYPFEFDEEVPLTLSDWYHQESGDIMKHFKSRYNPTGAEPVPQSALFNDSRNSVWTVEPDKTYFVRIVNMGMFVSQYLYIEGHNFTIVEIDGVYVQPEEADSLYIGVAQRYGVLVKTKKHDADALFRIVNVIDIPMLDVIPADLKAISTNYMQYGKHAVASDPLPGGPEKFDKVVKKLSPFDDFNLRPLTNETLLDDSDYQIVLNFTMENLGDGVVYALFNGITYVPPKVPTLFTVLSSGQFASNPAIYGSNTNTFVLQYGEVIEIVVNNMDPGFHPFHLHGHTFQVISRSEGTEDEENPIVYDSNNRSHTNFPEHPMVRDTVMVNPNGFVVLRFKAENPGVWFFHCHLDWHLEQGLAITLVEAPLQIQENEKPIHKSHFEACAKLNIPTKGNAAGNYGESRVDWLDLSGENVQPKPLPPGFTPRGYIALVICALAAIYGINSIYVYGIEDVNTENAGHMVAKLYEILDKHDSAEGETSTMLTLDSDGNRVGPQST